MSFRPPLFGGLGLSVGLLCCTVAAVAYQREFREYPSPEYRTFEVPADYKQPGEFVLGHLMYPDNGCQGGFGRRGRQDWRQGMTDWTNDYPRADRHLASAIRRLTSIETRSVEQPVNLEDGDDVFDWPFLYAVRTCAIDLTPDMVNKLREYIDRGGFFVADDMWGEREQVAIQELVAQLYPDRELVELDNDALAFHMLFDLNNRYQIIGAWGRACQCPLHGGADESTPHWKGVFDKKGRMVIAIWFNNDTGDSWEWADDPSYPEKWSALGIRMAVNHIAYAMTH
ncbi:MAG: DUF4159 domain-containing protein [Acidobacteriota bacterium]